MPSSSSPSRRSPAAPHTLVRGLSTRHVQFIALGSAIGTGLFYGSADAIRLAGPAVLLGYLASGLAVFMVMRALGEMAVRDPGAGSFGRYARTHLGPLAGFVTGWMFVLEMLVVAVADVTALTIYLGHWWPQVPGWCWVVATIALVTALNLIHVRVFGETEFWLSLIKVTAIVAMIVAGVVILALGLDTPGGAQVGVHNLWSDGGFAPYGAWGVLLSLTVVVFAFGGIETLGLSAAEAEDPVRAIPRAINTIPWRVLLFYVGAVGVVLCLAPWSTITGRSSAFVQIFDTVGLPAAANVLNAVVITAAFSALNAITFSIGRMLHGLADQGDAPASFARTNARGVPFVAVGMVAVALVVALVLQLVMPGGVFVLIASVASFATVFVWLMILLSHQAMRRREGAGAFAAPAWPVGSWLAIAFMVGVLALLAAGDATRPALWTGLAALVVLVVAQRLRGPDRDEDAEREGAVREGAEGPVVTEAGRRTR
ncbi:amino acid permease [Arsenicicoccus sp. oral taxon 190]|uniref:amino acid permease n=1 Tax=Arsenicicoccus sp. oral taxon 190 TaxID=1658671 RepID=UPI000B25BDCA|nr:amino acid permease [Arsenicicoccus sp. oral taxon 190]